MKAWLNRTICILFKGGHDWVMLCGHGGANTNYFRCAKCGQLLFTRGKAKIKWRDHPKSKMFYHRDDGWISTDHNERVEFDKWWNETDFSKFV